MSDPNQLPNPKKPIGIVRGAIATVGAVIMVLIGVPAFRAAAATGFQNVELVIAYAGLPFAVGLAIFCAALWAGRRQF